MPLLLRTDEEKAGVTHPAWTEIKITMARGPLDLYTAIRETEAHRMNTCKATAPRQDRKVRLECLECFRMLG